MEKTKDLNFFASIQSDEWERRGFTDPSMTELYATDREVDERNAIRLKALKKPIAWKLSSDQFYGLKNVLYLSVGAAVVLEQNLCPDFGLANGSVGIVHHIVHENDKPPSENLPKLIWLGQI
jgi:hypothetical protein